MTLKWIDGFESWGDVTYATRAYLTLSGVTPQSSGIGPRVSPGLRYGGFATTATMNTPSLGADNTWVVGFGFHSNSTSTVFSVRFLSGGSEQCRFETESSGGILRWRLLRGATVIASSSTFALNQWFYFELRVTARTGTNGAYEVRQNEVAIMSGSSVNLANVGTDGADSVGFSCATAACSVDDIYILDSAGAAPNNNFLGDSVAMSILPQAEGHQNDFTPSTGVNNAALADDPDTAASGADFNSSDTNNHEDYYTFTDLPGTGLGTIHGIKVSGSFAMASAGSRVARYRYYNGTTEFTLGANVSAASTSIVELPQVVGVNPDTGAAWTKTDIDNAEFGVEVVS